MASFIQAIGVLIIVSFVLFLILNIADNIMNLAFPEFFKSNDSQTNVIGYFALKKAIKYGALMIGFIIAGVTIYYVYKLATEVG